MNQDQLPTMLQYQGEYQELIQQEMVDVENFQNKIAQNHNRVVEDQLGKILENLQREYHSYLQNFESTIEWINEQIQLVTLLNPQYFRKQMKEKNILLKINLQNGFTLEWYNIWENQYNEDSWKKHIYDDFFNDKIFFDNLFPKKQIEQVLHDNDQYIKNELQKLLQTWVNKYQLAQTQLSDTKKSIEKLSSQREQSVMLVIAVKNIQLIFMGAEKEEKYVLDYKILQIKLALCLENFQVYYKQYGVVIQFDGNFTEKVFQGEKHFNVGKDFHDLTYELIQNRKQIYQDQSQSYFQVCKKLNTLFGQSPTKLNVIEQKMTKSSSQYEYPESEDQLIILTSTNINQFIILTFQKKLISVNLFESVSQDQGIESYCMEVPLPVLDYFVHSQIPLILIIIKAFELREKILDLDILNKIFQYEFDKIQRAITHQQNLDEYQFQINQNIRLERSLSDVQHKNPSDNQLTSSLMPGKQTLTNNNPKEQLQIERQSCLNQKNSHPVNQNIQQQIIIQDANYVNDNDQLDIEELKVLLYNNRKEVFNRIKKVLKPLIIEIIGKSKNADSINNKLTDYTKYSLEQMIQMTKDRSYLQNNIQQEGVERKCSTF